MSGQAEITAISAYAPETCHVQDLPLVAGIDAHSLNEFVASVQARAVVRGEHVLHKGKVGEHLLFVLSGRLQVVDLTEDGREIGLNFLITGDYFGELSIIDGLPRSASVVACEKSMIALLPRNQALKLIYHNPLVAERLLKKMAASIRTATGYRAILGIPNAYQRVFALLLQFSREAPGGLFIIDNLPTQNEIAITVNTSRETVSRAIHTLIKKRILEKDFRRLIVRKPEELKKAVQDNFNMAIPR